MISDILEKIKLFMLSNDSDYTKLQMIKREVNSYSRAKQYKTALNRMDDYFTSTEFNSVCSELEIPQSDSNKFLHRACKRGEIERTSYGKYKKV